LWIGYPKLRLVYLAGVLTVAVALVGADFHFVSDVVAGAFVGATIGWMTMTLAAAIKSTARTG
jgi:membrane-associated phospholipid phosphatase